MKPLVATVAVLVALATGAPVQAQTPELDELRALAEQGDASVQILLGVMYDNGRGVPQDDTEAVRWYRLAANQRHARAQLNLGVKYRNGEGTPQDFVEAHAWANLAASQLSGEDRDFAVRHRDDLAAQMTPDQIAEAQRRAREWPPTPGP